MADTTPSHITARSRKDCIETTRTYAVTKTLRATCAEQGTGLADT